MHLPPEPPGLARVPLWWPDGCLPLCAATRASELETVESQDHHLGRKQLLGSLPDSTPKQPAWVGEPRAEQRRGQGQATPLRCCWLPPSSVAPWSRAAGRGPPCKCAWGVAAHVCVRRPAEDGHPVRASSREQGLWKPQAPDPGTPTLEPRRGLPRPRCTGSPALRACGPVLCACEAGGFSGES